MSAPAPEIRPRADIAKGPPWLHRPRKMVKRGEVLREGAYSPPAAPALAKPAGDLIPLGDVALSETRKTKMRDRLITASYLVAVTVAMIGWLWLIAWMAMRLV